MSEQELDPQVIAAIERAARGNPELRSAASAIFAALTRRDEREREALTILAQVWRDWAQGKLPTSGPEMLTYQPMADAARLLNRTDTQRMREALR